MDYYAFHLIAMSMDEAKSILGLSIGSAPTPSEIKHAYRAKALEVHPDRGGSNEAMQEVNAAKDILEGKQRPSYSRTTTRAPTTPGGHWQPPKAKEVSFQEAESKAGIPSGVTWMFVTPFQRGTSWSGDESSQSDSSFVAYGRMEHPIMLRHVFVGARHFSKSYGYVGGGPNEDIWTIKSRELPIQGDDGKNPAWLYGNVVQALKGIGFEGRFNSKVIDAKGWSFSHRIPTGSTTSIKHWLVGSGEVAGDAPAVAGRKQVVEFTFEKAYEEKPGYVPEPTSYGSPYYYKLALLLNGRRYDFDEGDVKKFLGLKAGGKSALGLIFGRYQYGGEKKNLTRMPKGKKIIHWMTENLKSLPDDAMSVLRAAEAQMKD